MSTQKTALITGASAGIGKAFAEHLALQGYNLILVARRKDKLSELADQLGRKYGIDAYVLAADLAQPDAVTHLAAEVQNLGLSVDFLINNAGLSGNYKFTDASWTELAAEIQIMITSLTQLCHVFLPKMKARQWGRVINVSSIAAYAPPGASLLYTGIKSYVLNASQAMDMELKPHGVNVTALCPGFTRSEFHDVMGTRGTTNKFPNVMWQGADEVAEEAYKAVMAGHPVCVTGWFNKASVAVMKPLPEGVRYRLGKAMNPFKN
ncbi:MAG: SDR family oxidoreductase [Limnobacter sp.]|nr:SDR family oxidoreductase [Limnobacter sp.]